MGGRRSKEKGKRGEREFAALLRTWGFVAFRGVQFQGSHDSPDLNFSSDPRLSRFHPEVKRVERFQLYAALRQAEEDSGGTEKIPLVIHRANKKGWVVVLRAEDFFQRVLCP